MEDRGFQGEHMFALPARGLKPEVGRRGGAARRAGSRVRGRVRGALARPRPLCHDRRGRTTEGGMTRTAWQAAVEALEAEGVEYAFGLSGNPLHLVADLHGTSVKPILARNESSAVYMAYGYARVARKVGICFGNPGPGHDQHGVGPARGGLGVRAGDRPLERHGDALRRRRRAAGARRADPDAAGHEVVGAALEPRPDAVDHAPRVPRRAERPARLRVRRGARRPRPAGGRDGRLPLGRAARPLAPHRRRDRGARGSARPRRGGP